MKFSTISGASTLFCILTPVIGLIVELALIPVPDMNREFSLQCPNGPEYTKAELLQKVLLARQYMHPDKPEYDFPREYSNLPFGIPGDLWYYPMAEGPQPHIFVVFNLENRVAGAVSRTNDGNGPDVVQPCDFV
ncbi:BgTH12-04528 [Blumeria graminis f. sp. triticale]|nr:BgTH12-04528 [Blumeria graminis f. sp. triticale]